ncbi:MAG: hypothetical protein PF636_03330 [Actinomycetota bacterium]|jgi:hypothetical protein|nr:hypothetical protein [Actinomycetota bacterium]
MDWQRWIDDGLVRPSDTANERALPHCTDAWDRVVEARHAYLAGQWELADERLRTAMKTAAEALVYYHHFEPTAPDSYELAHRACREVFGERMIERIFDRADILKNMMPLPETIPELESREVRRSVAASAELVALVEAFVYL